MSFTENELLPITTDSFDNIITTMPIRFLCPSVYNSSLNCTQFAKYKSLCKRLEFLKNTFLLHSTFIYTESSNEIAPDSQSLVYVPSYCLKNYSYFSVFFNIKKAKHYQ